MTSLPLVSIILPVHNGARYLAQSIESCLAQTYENWELILVDDCSTDETPKIIASFAARDSRIRALRHETNKKLPAALNTGFAFSRGAYLTWTSDDNLYRPRALETLCRFLNENPRIGLVYSDYSIINATGEETQKQTVKSPEKLVTGCIVGASFLYRREVYASIGGYAEDAFLAEDYDYWLRVFSKFDIAPLHEDLYLYRKHANSLAATQRHKIRQAGYQIKCRALPALLPKLSADDKGLAYLHLSRDAQALGRPLQACAHFFRAATYSPRAALHWLKK